MWTAIILGALVAGGYAAYGAWAAQAVGQGAPLWPFVVAIPFAYLVFPLAFTIFWFVLAWWFRADRPVDVHLGVPARIAMFFLEFWAIARSVPRMILYRLLMPEPKPAPAALPVVFLHGIGCNAGVWDGFRRDFERRAVRPLYALSYGPPLGSIEDFADQLAAKIATVVAATGAGQVVLVGHSMGGLVARAYLRRYGAANVRRLVTIGTPHLGCMHAWFMCGPALVQMRPGSAWLAELNRSASAGGVPTVSIWSWHDSMVTPQTSPCIDWGENVILAGVAHNALLDDPEVQNQVAQEIERAATSGSPA
jgi:pimeloyl-ACP methyl ester carboxylesterase